MPLPNDWPDTLTVEPDPATVDDQSSVQFQAVGHYDDARPDQDLTYACVWNTGDHSVATVNGLLIYGSGARINPGLAFGVTPGTVNVGAEPMPQLFDDVTAGPPGGWPVETAAWVGLTVTAGAPAAEPEGRFCLAFTSSSLDPDPVWTRLDSIPNLVTSYTIDRGRQFELDRTDTGRATVQITDPDGILDPTNPDGPYYGHLQPLLQAAIGRYDPVAETWALRYRGFVEDFSYDIDPSQRVNRLTLSLVDLFEILAACEMHPGVFGTAPPAESEGQVYYARQTFHDRIVQVLTDAGLARRFWVVFDGNVYLKPVVYSGTGESALAAIQEAADGEFPGVGNTYCDRLGRLCAHDRKSRFDPEGVSTAVGAANWGFRAWKAGDGAAVAASPTDTAQVRELAFSRSLSKVINSASATPVGIIDTDVPGALYVDAASIGLYGIRSWSADNLLTDGDIPGVTGDLFEAKQFAVAVVTNYAQPRDRITTIGFRPLRPDDERAAVLWEFLNTVDISDSVEVTVAAAGGGGFTSEAYFVEGIHEQVGPLTPGYDDVTLHLDLSPRAYYAVDPFP